MELANESDVVNNVIIPQLKNLGIYSAQMQFERTFTVTLGRADYKIGGRGDDQTSAGGRLDILVKGKDGRNLFVVEVKAEDKQLDEKTRKQVISYARLVQPIAPYAITTNGNRWRIYDVLSCEEVESADIDTGKEIQLPDEAANEAREYFFGYARTNVLTFCRTQVERALKPYKMGAGLTKKYIPEIYVPNEQVSERFERFRRSEQRAFLVLANSGMGKTNWASACAENLLERGEACLFFKARDVRNGIPMAIAEKMGWFLSPMDQPRAGFRRVLKALAGEELYLIVDGLDEVGAEAADQITGELLDDLVFLKERRAANVRLVCTCTFAGWERIREQNGLQARLSISVEQGGERSQAAYEVISAKQRDEMVRRYRNYFDFSGTITNGAMELFRASPFFMRIAFHVANEQSLESLGLDIRAAFDIHWKESVKRFDRQRDARRLLVRLADRMLKTGRGELSIDQVYDLVAAELDNVDELIEQARRLQVLVTSEDSGSERVAFYLVQLRSYLIIFHARKWADATTVDFKNEVLNLASSTVSDEALGLYCHFADEEHLRAIGGRAYTRAREFLDAYEGLLDEYLPRLKTRIRPYSEKIGVVVAADLTRERVLGMGWRPIESDDRRVVILPVFGEWKEFQHRIEQMRQGMDGYGVARWFQTDFSRDENAWAHAELRNSLERLIEDPDTLRAACDKYRKERIFRLAQSLYHRTLRQCDPTKGKDGTLNLKDMLFKVRKDQASCVLREKWTDEKRKQKMRDSAPGRVFFVVKEQPTEGELDEMESQAERAARDGAWLESRRRGENVAERRELHELLTECLEEGRKTLDWPYLPETENEWNGDTQFHQLWREETVGRILAEVWEDAYRCEGELVEECFRELRMATSLESEDPKMLFLEFTDTPFGGLLRVVTLPSSNGELQVTANARISLETSSAEVRAIIDGDEVNGVDVGYIRLERPLHFGNRLTLLHDKISKLLRESVLTAWDEVKLGAS
ncbi:MAG: hypothetical protein ACQEVA_03115 [Myxococcota bacterium]